MAFKLSVKSVNGLLTTYFHASSTFLSSLNPHAAPVPSSFDWNSISPSPNLIYHACYERLECARLEVPLDWSNLSNPNQVVLAIARLPAKVDVNDATFGGTIVLNPGGPGGSGITLIHDVGLWLQEIVDDRKHYELLSFDPRGVHHTTPSVACFRDSFSREVFQAKMSALDTLDSTEALNFKWATVDGFGSLCAGEEVAGYKDGSNIRSYVSTRLVARDMIAIVDKVDEQRHGNSPAFRKAATREGGGTSDTNQHVMHRDPVDRHQVPLINYWGFSYGTILGNTLVSLFPERIGRAVLDGVADAVDYFASPGWLSNLQNADDALQSLYRYCFESDSACPLFKKSDKGPSCIESRVNRFLQNLAQNPMSTIHDGTTELVTYADVRKVIFRSTYSPTQYYPALAQLLSDLISGNTTLMIPRLQHIALPDDRDKPYDVAAREPNICDEAVPFPKDDYAHQGEASAAILCGDSDLLTSFTKPKFAEYIAELQSQSKIFGSYWAEIKLTCTHWPSSLRPSEANRFKGPFKSFARDYDSRGAPVLFIGNMFDNVTPLRNAHAMSEGHEGSVVLTQDSSGHCSAFSSPSECTRKVIRRYFDTGELPANGTICKADRVPWDGKGEKTKTGIEMSS